MGLFDKLKKGLSKTREKITGGLRSVLPVGRKIDDAVLDELEESMLAADIGPVTVSKLIDSTRAAWKRGKVKNRRT
jgi:fused signal recognition particle receptor